MKQIDCTENIRNINLIINIKTKTTFLTIIITLKMKFN